MCIRDRSGGGHVEDGFAARRVAGHLASVRPHSRRRPVQPLRHAAGGLAGAGGRGQRIGGCARRGERRHRPGGDGQAGGAQALHHRPHRAGSQRHHGPGGRSRRRDPAGGRHPDAATPEQPDPDRRAGCRQDGHRRGPGAAHRARRRAADAEGRRAAHARRRPAVGRRQHEGRIRATPARRDRRGAGEPEADRAVHRRDAHAGRGRWRGWHRGRGQPAQARARARSAAHHRRHDFCRIQEVHREGSGTDAAVPGRAGRRARGGQGDPDAARCGEHAREAPSRDAARCRDRGVVRRHPAVRRDGPRPGSQTFDDRAAR